MARIKPFVAMIDVASEMYEQMPDETGVLVRQALTKQLSGDLRGPRGGRYERVSDIRFVDDPWTSYERPAVCFAARCDARYVRPSHG